MKTRIKIFQPKTKFILLPKIRWRPKKKRSWLKLSPLFGPKLGEDQKNKWKVFPQFSPVFGQKKSLCPPFLCSNLLPKSQRRGEWAMPQLCILFYANYTIPSTRRGGHGPKAPPKYAPVCNSLLLVISQCTPTFRHTTWSTYIPVVMQAYPTFTLSATSATEILKVNFKPNSKLLKIAKSSTWVGILNSN